MNGSFESNHLENSLSIFISPSKLIFLLIWPVIYLKPLFFLNSFLNIKAHVYSVIFLFKLSSCCSQDWLLNFSKCAPIIKPIILFSYLAIKGIVYSLKYLSILFLSNNELGP